MKIVFLTKYFPPDAIGGGEVSAYYLALALVKKGHQVIIIKRGEKDKDLNELGIEIWERRGIFNQEVPNFEQIFAKKRAKKLAKMIPSDADVVHAHDFHSALIAGELKKIIPINPLFIATVRDYWPVCGYGKVKMNGEVCKGCLNWNDFKDCPKVASAKFPINFLRAWRYLYNIPDRQKMLTMFDRVVFISETLRDEIKKAVNFKVSLENEKVIYNPVPSEAQNYQKDYNLGKGNKIFYAGMLDIHKGVDVLLKAFAKVRLKREAELVIAGAGPLFNDYKKMADNLRIKDKVQFLGHVPYKLMFGLYRKSDLVISPALWPEPFGRTILEGMAYGLPVIATSIGAAKEIIKNKEMGILVEAGNVLELTERIIYLLDHQEEAQEMGMRAREEVLERFKAEKIAGEYEEIYKSR